jgi:hypothetical protein
VPPTESLNTLATCFIVCPLPPGSSPIEISQCVRLDIWHTAEARLSAGSFHHLGLMR